MAKGIKRKIAIARKNIQKEISGFIDDSSQRSSFFSRGVSGEGFNGGYRAALDDVLLALNGVTPRRNGWWDND